jgi:hypothetical protein
LPLISLQWLGFAAVAAAVLLGGFLVQTGLLWAFAGRRSAASWRAAAWSFAPMLLLWPLLLAVTFWDAANHLFVFHPGVALWWGGVAFAFVVSQIALVPLQLDGGAGWIWSGLSRAVRGLPRASLTGPYAIPIVLFAYVALRLTVRFAFEMGTRIDPGRAYGLFYNLATLTDQGVYPYLGRWSEYPPLFPWFSTGVYRAVSFFGVTYERYYIAITLALLLFGVGILVLVYKLTELAWDRTRAIHAAWAYTALAVPMYEWVRTFNSMGVFFLLLGVYLGARGRRYAGVLVVVIGALTKVIPIIAGVQLLRYASGLRNRGGLLLTGAAAAALGLVPFWAFGREWFSASLGNMLARPPWQTPWALLDGHFGQGWVNSYRLNTEFATAYDYTGRLPGWIWPLLVVALVAAYAYLLFMRRPADDARTQVRIAFLSLLILLLTLKGWSPSFVVWIIPFLIVVYPNGRGLVLAVVIGTVETFWRPLGLQFGYPDALVVTLVMARTVFFAVLAVLMYRAIARSRGTSEMGAVPEPVAP